MGETGFDVGDDEFDKRYRGVSEENGSDEGRIRDQALSAPMRMSV